jgi:hypothetical protein
VKIAFTFVPHVETQSSGSGETVTDGQGGGGDGGEVTD